jgi:hypothetical protein
LTSACIDFNECVRLLSNAAGGAVLFALPAKCVYGAKNINALRLVHLMKLDAPEMAAIAPGRGRRMKNCVLQ